MKKFLFTAAVIGVTAVSFAQVPNYVPTNGLVGWWPFNGNANDESGNGNNGTVNGATLTTDRFGNVNKAYSFDGVDDFISINSGLINETGFSVSCWISTQFSGEQSIFYDGMKEFHLGQFAPNFVWLSGVKCNTGSWFFNNGIIPVLNDEIFITTTYNQSGRVYFYLNSLLVDSSSIVNCSNFNNPAYLSSVGAYAGSQRWFNGKIDDIGLWNRPLTQCEIQQLYNASIPSSSQTQSALDSYTWPVNGQTYMQSGTYTATIPNAAGCDSIITLNLSLSYTGIEELSPDHGKTLIKITDLNGKETPFKKNTVLFFIYEDGTVERVYVAE